MRDWSSDWTLAEQVAVRANPERGIKEEQACRRAGRGRCLEFLKMLSFRCTGHLEVRRPVRGWLCGSGTWERRVGRIQIWKSSAHGKETDDRIKISQ